VTAFLTGGGLADVAGHFRDAFARYTSTAGARNEFRNRQGGKAAALWRLWRSLAGTQPPINSNSRMCDSPCR